MNREQAKLILGAWRSGEGDGEDTLLAEALACMEEDPVLAEWFAAEMAADDAMRSSLRTVEPPPHLREAILAGAQPARPSAAPPVPKSAAGWWWALAAGFVAAVAAVYLLAPGESRLQTARLTSEIPVLTAAHEHGFASPSGDLAAVRQWLASHDGAADFVVPGGLRGRGAVGCDVVPIDGTRVSVLCFHVGGGKTVHLYVVDQSRLTVPPGGGEALFQEIDGVAVASWSQGGQSYFLAGRGTVDSLREWL